MRVAYLINQYPKISHSFIRREILALERRGIEIKRIALRGWEDHLTDKEDQLERDRTDYVLREGALALLLATTRLILTRPIRVLRALAIVWRMGRRSQRPLPVHLIYLAEACRITLWLYGSGIRHVHAHFGTNSAEVALLVHTLGGPRWSFTVHGPEEFDKAQLIHLAEKTRDAEFIVAVSSFGRSQLYRLMEYSHWRKVQVVHCGLDTDFLSVPETNISVERRLVCVGRICEQKGHLLLLEAAHKLAVQGIDFTLVLAGDGELRAEVEALIAHYNLHGRVRITGWLNSEQVRNEILAAQALVLPSFAEGLPVVVMEAMALRRPIISTYIAGIPELVHPPQHGWLVAAGDAEALANAMRACLDAPYEVRTSMGESAYKTVLEHHNIDTEVAKLADLFQASSSIT